MKKMDLKIIVKKFHKMDLINRIFAHKIAAKSGLYMGQPPLLEYIIEHGNCTQKEVADKMQVSPPSIANSVKRMEKAGLLLKTIDESNLRCNKLSVTPKGYEVAKRVRTEFDKRDKQMFKGFSPEELQNLSEYLDKIIDNISSGEFDDKTIFSLAVLEKELQRKENNQTLLQEEQDND